MPSSRRKGVALRKSAALRLLALEDRTVPAGNPNLIAAGDYYRDSGETIELKIRANELAVRIDDPAVAAHLVAPGAPLGGFSVDRWADNKNVAVFHSAPAVTIGLNIAFVGKDDP